MSDLPMLSAAQMRRIEPYFPLSHGVPRVDDRRVLSGIIYVIKNGLRWCDAPSGYMARVEIDHHGEVSKAFRRADIR